MRRESYCPCTNEPTTPAGGCRGGAPYEKGPAPGRHVGRG